MTGSSLHEPKNIDTAGTSDAGKVLNPSASTAGLGVLRQLVTSEITTGSDAEFSTYESDGAGALRIRAVIGDRYAGTDFEGSTTATVISTQNTWTEMNLTDMVEDISNGMTYSSGRIQVDVTADYIVSMHLSFQAASASDDFMFDIAADGTPQGHRIRVSAQATTDYMPVTCTFLHTFVAGVDLSLYIQNNTGTGNLTITDFSLVVHEIKGG